jgi:hypothetical protein
MWIVVRAGGGRAGGMAGARLPPPRPAGMPVAGPAPRAVSSVSRVARACEAVTASEREYLLQVRSVRPLDLQRPRYK